MNKLVTDNARDSLEACVGSVAFTTLRMKLGSNLAPLEAIGQEMSQIFSPEQQGSPFRGEPPSTDGQKEEVEILSSSSNLGVPNSVFGASAGTYAEPSAMDIGSTVESNPTEVQMKG